MPEYNEVNSLKKRLDEMDRRIRNMETAPRAAHTAIDHGGIKLIEEGTITANAGTAELVRVGKQDDGTYAALSLGGPVPPTPTPPVLEPLYSAIKITWDGLFTDSLVAPLDFSRVEIHVSVEPGFTPDLTTLINTFESPQGGQLTVSLPEVEHHVKFITRSLSGKPSLESAQASATPLVLSAIDVGVDIEALEQATADAADVADQALTEAQSKPSKDYIASRGTDLVTNGTGLLGNNTNFSWSTFNPVDAPVGSVGSFVSAATSPIAVTIDENIPYDPSKRYIHRWSVKQLLTTGQHYGFVEPKDSSGLTIVPYMYTYTPNSTTVLTQDLVAGATQVYVDDATSWYNGTTGAYRYLIFWNYTDPNGKSWPAGTYSRNVFLGQNQTNGAYDAGGANTATGVITLNSPYSGPTVPAGTAISNARSGSYYVYSGAIAATVAASDGWKTFTSEPYGGVLDTSLGQVASVYGGLPPATAYIRVGWLLNYNVAAGTSQMAIAGVSFSDSTAAYSLASTASASAISAQESADGKNTIIHATTDPTLPYPGAIDDTWFKYDGSSQIVGQWRWTGSAWVSQTIENALIANLDAGKLTANSITADKLETNLALVTNIIAGDETGAHAAMEPTGFKVYRDTLDGPEEVVRLGTSSSDYLGVVDSNGDLIASINADGGGSFNYAVIAEDLSYKGRELTEYLEDRALGLQAYARVQVNGQALQAGTVKGMFELNIDAKRGRAYRVVLSGGTIVLAGSGASGPYVRWTVPSSIGGVAPKPTLTNGYAGPYSYVTGTGANTPPPIDFVLRCAADGLFTGLADGGELTEGINRVLFAYVAGGGVTFASSPGSSGDLYAAVYDVGRTVPYGYVLNNSTVEAPETTGQAPVRYVKTYTPSWSRNYLPSNAHTTYGAGKMYQGYWNSTTPDHSLAGFSSQIMTDLTGATVEKVEVYTYFRHWSNGSGGIARIGVHGLASDPGTASQAEGTFIKDSTLIPKPGDAWTDITSTAAGWKSGAYRGIALGRWGSSSLTYYGYADPVTLRITYTK